MVLEKGFEFNLIEAFGSFFKTISHRYCGKFPFKRKIKRVKKSISCLCNWVNTLIMYRVILVSQSKFLNFEYQKLKTKFKYSKLNSNIRTK